MADQIMPPWRKSIRSNASSGCVEVTWTDVVSHGGMEVDVRPSE
jgi:Domain of unknown function (DUF397)